MSGGGGGCPDTIWNVYLGICHTNNVFIIVQGVAEDFNVHLRVIFMVHSREL